MLRARVHVAGCVLGLVACLGASGAHGEGSAETRSLRTGVSAGIVIDGIDLVMEDAYLVTEPDGGVRVEAPSPGQSVYFQGDWGTDGLGGSVHVAMAAIIDGALFCQADLFTEPGEGGIVYCNAPWIATSGTHDLRWEIDYFDQAAEIDESNNSAVLQFTTLQTPTRTRTHTAIATASRTPTASRSPTRTRTGTRTPTRPRPTSTRLPTLTPVRSATPAEATPTRTSSRTSTAASPSPTPTLAMSHAGFFARGDANCDVVFTAADVVATVLARDSGSICGNDDCDRDGQMTTEDLTCAAHCVFGVCASPPQGPRVTAVEPVSAAAIAPLTLVRVIGTNLDVGERLPRASIGGEEADVIEVVSATEWLVVVPDLEPGPADVVLINGDLDGAPFSVTVAPAAPVGQTDGLDETLDLLDDEIGQFLTVDFQALYGESATVIRRALEDFRGELGAQRAALAADPTYTAEVRLRLDAAIDASGAAEMLRAAVEQIGGVGLRERGTAPVTVIARVVGRTTHMVGTVVLRAAPALGGAVLAPLGKIAAAAVVVGGMVTALADTPVITKLLPDHPRPGETLEIEGYGFGSLPPLPSLVVQTSGGEIEVPAEGRSGTLLRFRFPSAPGVCGPLTLALKRLLRRSNSVSVKLQPVLLGLSHAIIYPGDTLELRTLGTTPCGAFVRFANSSLSDVAPLEYFEVGGINTMRGRIPERWAPGRREVFLDAAGLRSAESLPLQVANPIENLRIECDRGTLVLPPGRPSDGFCQVSTEPSGTGFPDGTRVTWMSSQPAVASVGGIGRFSNVHAVGVGETTIHAEATIDGTPGGVIGRSRDGVQFEIRDETPPCDVSLSAHPPGAPLTIDAGSSFRVRATAEDNFRVNFLEVSTDSDAVGSPSPEDFGCPLEKTCTRTFRFDVRASGFQSRQVAVVARARDSSGNPCSSTPLVFVVRNLPSATPANTRTRTPTATQRPTLTRTRTSTRAQTPTRVMTSTPTQTRTWTHTSTRTRTPTRTSTASPAVDVWSRVGAPDVEVSNTIAGRTLVMRDGSAGFTREFGNWDVSFTWQAPQRIEADKQVSFRITAAINSWDAFFGQVRAGFDVDAVAPGHVDVADATDLGGGPQPHSGDVTFTLPQNAPDEVHLIISVTDGSGSHGAVDYLYRRQ